VLLSISRWMTTATAGLLAAAVAPAAVSPEAATARYFASIRNDPPRLVAFLTEMPKGGDLHNHLSGAVYAESYASWAAADGLCVNVATMALVSDACAPARGLPSASAAFQDQATLNAFVDAVSMRHWDRGRNGHDQFFNAFAKFGAASGPPGDKLATRFGDMIAEVSARAAGEHVSYVELMLTPDGGAASAAGAAAGWDPDLATLRAKLLAADFTRTVVERARQNLERAEGRRRELLRCDGERSPEGSRDGGSGNESGSATASAERGCAVTVRYIAQVARSAAPAVVFAQMLAGFEEASAQTMPVVGLNLVAPEDNPVALRDFRLHMSMLAYLRTEYPSVHLTLHAGELAPGLVPPDALRFHIRDSVEKAGAVRIGHGAAVMFEDDADALLREMAAKRVLVEIALSSNDLILGISGRRHPLSAYLRAGVPVAIVTDDAGVARSTETWEFERAVEDQGLDYLTLKRLARNSIDYAFADAETKAALRRNLDAALASFEKRQASRTRDGGVRRRSERTVLGRPIS
jgi:adenosine deaminase